MQGTIQSLGTTEVVHCGLLRPISQISLAPSPVQDAGEDRTLAHPQVYESPLSVFNDLLYWHFLTIFL